MSRKSHEPTDASRQRVMIMVAGGVDQAGIAFVLGISEPTLRKRYKPELANGYASITARIAARQIAKADAGDERAIEFYLERRGGWVRRDNVQVANADDKPFNLTITYRKPDVPGAG